MHSLATGQYVGNVAGIVRDAATHQPIAAAAVVLVGATPNASLRALTDSDGRFLINNVPVKYPFTTYSVVASAARHDSQLLANVRILPGAVMALESSFALPLVGTGANGLFNDPAFGALFAYSHERSANSDKAQSGKIFATREGLVGRTTANGHVIRSDDRFVALPYMRALNRGGERKFLVKLGYGNQSAIVPVWDIGPWNIKDDYWSPPSERESWRNLPRGLPDAQAAYFDRHNSGRDGLGRRVMNPAGIDLSDEVFWRDLHMTENDWITVEYLWDPSVISMRNPSPEGATKHETK